MRDYWNGRRVLLTGGAGFLGSHLAQMLLSRGALVTALSHDGRQPLHYEGAAGRPRCRAVDVADYQALAAALADDGIEVVFHIAARSIVGEANRDPVPVFETNIRGTWNLLEACRRNPAVKKVVVSSSDKAYGPSDVLPYLETTPLRGSHPYDVSKSCADLISLAYFNSYRLPVCVTRCCNYFGPGDLHFNRIVPGTIIGALKGQAPVIRSDGLSVRDYMYIKDGALAHLLLAEKMDDPAILGQAFNFTSQQPLTVLEITQAVLKAMGREDLRPQVLNHAPNEIRDQYLCADKAAGLLGWRPVYAFEEALRETVAWYSGPGAPFLLL
jgi:dTDP-D-glucose 4,6-dehydratase